MIHILGILTRTVFSSNRVFLFGAPFHENLGDHAQSYVSCKWFAKYCPGKKPLVFDTIILTVFDYALLRIIRKLIKDTDMIVLHSGHHTSDVYPIEENMQRTVTRMFPDFPLLFLPQTVIYVSEDQKQEAIECYNQHPNLTMLCRDQISYETALELFPQCKPDLYPDIVATLIGTRHYSHPRAGILMCIRNDLESFYSRDEIDNLAQELRKIDQVELTDTDVNVGTFYLRRNLESILEKCWEEYSRYRVIITDRYHGTIFALIANTPVVVIATAFHKNKSVVDWFPPELFSEYVCYADSMEDAVLKAQKFYNHQGDYQTPDYVNQFYDRLIEKLQG